LKPKRQVPYDFESWRIISKDLTELNATNKDWPKYRFGTVTTSPAKYPSRTLEIHYRIEFITESIANLEFAFNHPRLGKEVKHAAEAKLGGYRGRLGIVPTWYFACTMQKHKWCWKNGTSLWLGAEEKLACQNCAHIKRYSKVIEDRLTKYRKNPSLIPYTLSKAGASEKQKKYAILALEKLSRKFVKMTDNYNVLSVEERNYYRKLRVVLFPSKKIIAAFIASNKYDIPLPFLFF